MQRFEKPGSENPTIQGWLHEPSKSAQRSMILTHGAGTNCEAPLLVAVAKAFADAGTAVLRYDLPFRQGGGGGAMNAAVQARDREGIQHAAQELRKLYPKVPLVLAGHSYGGRQSSMLAAAEPFVCQALMLLSYPLHPPRQPDKLRTEHLSAIQCPCLFVHGTRDPFGTIEEMQQALRAIPSPTQLQPIERGAHNLPEKIAVLLPDWLSAIMGT